MHLYYSIWIVFTCIICISLSASKIPVFIGVMMSRNNSAVAADVGYQTSASAVYLAIDRAKNESLINRFDLRIEFVFDDCNEANSAGLTAQLMADNVTAIIGPSCNDGALAAGTLSTFYNIPIITWGDVTNSAISDVTRFPATITVAPMSQSIAIALLQLLQQFDWNQFVYFYGNTDFCNNLQSDINNQSYLYPDLTLVRSIQLLDYSTNRIVTNLQKIPSLGRVIVMCFADDLTYVKRSVALALLDQGMLSTEYVILFVDNTVSFTIVTPTVTGDKVVNLWEDNSTTPDGRDADAFLAFQQIFSMRTAVPVNNASTQFQQQVIEDMSKPPLNCIQECAAPQYQTAATYANQLFDAMYMYLRALNKTIKQKQNIRDGATIILNTAGTFEGQSGTVVMNDVGVRCPILFVLSLDNNGNTNVMANLSVDQFTANYTQVVPLSVMWKRYGGHPPPAIPECGLMNENCPVSFFVAYLWIVIIGAVLLVIITITTLGSGFCYLRAKKEEEEHLNELWQIPTVALIKPGHKKKLESERSLQSGPSTTSTRITENSMNETAKFAYYLFEKEPVAAEKHGFHPRLTKSDTADLRHMCELDHENLNRFIGLCIDGPICLSVWKYCSRGSIKKVLEKGTLSLDGFFIYSIMSDIANGLAFIHKSILGCHGYLTSSCCFINDRWQIKIGGYGLKFLREREKREEKQLLYTAPEILRGDDEHLKTKEADIYSFAIICSELITRKGVWNMNNRKEEPDEIIFMVKRGGRHVVRPDLKIPSDTDINPALLLLTRECWDEEPARRPKIEFIRNSLKRLQNGRNLMDHVFNVLEKYASTLEEEVEDRMKELVEEKKKSDILLYRMLPQQVAEKLKLGQSVQPESFDSVTIFFSDVVSFTKLASKCTPLQVVNLLNDLYTTFDAIIDDHDAYKVETIGDGYLCVSGLPRRNGNEHIREICSMALALLRSLKSFRILHLPKERINIRVGIHTGSCVAGVVGLTMPRYCLFGDSVNTASRMESNGKPGRIHLSPESHSLLVKMYPQYKTESRGEVIIKGKGVMETFWLINDDGELSDDEEKNPNK